MLFRSQKKKLVAPAIAWRSGGDGDREERVMAPVIPAEATTAWDPIGGGASAAPRAEALKPRDPIRRGISIGGTTGAPDWEEVKAEARRIIRRSTDRKRCWKQMKR